MKHGKTPTSVGAAGRWVLVAVTLVGLLWGSRFAEAAREEGPQQQPTPQSNARPELFTNVYVVPPTFLNFRGDRGYVPPSDPFAAPSDADDEFGPLSRRASARDVLESYGVSFGEGSSAAFNPQTSQVIVRQTRDQMELVEAVIESLRDVVSLFVHLQYRIIESDERLLEPSSELVGKGKDRAIDPDSGLRRVGEAPAAPRSPIPALALEGLSIFTAEDLESFLGEIRGSKRGRIRQSDSLLTRSGQRWEMWVADALTEIDPVIGADSFTVDLNLELKNGRPDRKATAAASRQITLSSEQTVAFEEKLADGTYRTRLVTASVVDAAGMPVKEPSPNLQARVFAVPGFPTDDPSNPKVKDARKTLERFGIFLGASSRAIHNPASETLFVRGTDAEIELIRAAAQQWEDPLSTRKQIHYSIKEVELDPQNSKMGDLLSDRRAGNSASIHGIAGVFTDPQFQVIIRNLNHEKGTEIVSAPSVSARSGQPVLSQHNEKRWGFRGVVGGDEYTIEVQFWRLKPDDQWPRKILEGDSPGFPVTIWDGQTIAYSYPAEDGKRARVVFLTANLIDPASARRMESEPPRSPAPSEPAAPGHLTTAQQNAVRKADELALRGSQLMADGDLDAAAENFAESLRLLPEHEITGQRREAYQRWLEKARGKGLPQSPAPSLFPEPEPEGYHAAFEIAADERLVLHDVVRGETYYSVARRYGTSPRRLRIINRSANDDLAIGDRLIVPIRVQPPGPPLVELPTWDRPDSSAKRKAEEIVLPRVEFEKTPLKDALGFLRVESATHDRKSPDGEGGLDFILEVNEEIARTPITLRLSNVPLIDAIRYTAALAGVHFEFGKDSDTVRFRGAVSLESDAEPWSDADPSKLWFVAYSLLKEGQEANEAGRGAEALEIFQKSQTIFSALKKKHPEFYPELLNYRLEQLRETIRTCREKAADK